MSHKKAQTEIFISIVVIIVGLIGFFIGFVVASGGSITGEQISVDGSNITCSDISQTEAEYKVIGKNACSDKGGLFSGADCTVKIKNLEEVEIAIKPVFSCETLDDSTYVNAEPQALLPGETADVEIEFDNNRKDWSCTLVNANAMKNLQICKEV